MQSRKNLFSSPGGDTIQILKTKEYIEKLRIKTATVHYVGDQKPWLKY